MPTRRCFPKRLIAVLARRVVKPTMWNAGTIPAANRTHATFARLYRFQNPISTTNWLLDCLSSVTISNYHLPFNHYPYLKNQDFPKVTVSVVSSVKVDQYESQTIYDYLLRCAWNSIEDYSEVVSSRY